MSKYPIELLPNENYKLIRDGIVGFYLIRTTNTKENLLNDSNEIQQEYICSPREHIQDLSTSLLSIFEPEHSYIELTSIGKEKYSNGYCKPDCKVAIPEFIEDYTINIKNGYWFVLIDKIEGQVANYLHSNPPLNAKCCICHTPTKWNFWHFSIRWKFEDGKFWDELPDDEKNKDRLKKRLATEARAIIAKFAQIPEPDYFELDSKFYQKT